MFGSLAAGQETKLSAEDYATWPAHLIHWHCESLVLTGHDATHNFGLQEMLIQHDLLLESKLTNNKSQITIALYIVSIEELFTVTMLRAADNKIFKRLLSFSESPIHVDLGVQTRETSRRTGRKNTSWCFLRILPRSPTGTQMSTFASRRFRQHVDLAKAHGSYASLASHF